LLVSVFAVEGRKPEAGRVHDETSAVSRRACGEIRIPLRHLVTKCDSSLYHSWVALDSPGVNESVNFGMLNNGMADTGEAFAQALAQGPRQLSQPKACLSVVRAEDLGPNGQVMWTDTATRKERIARWGPLLRSQQHHVVLCTAQHLQSTQAQKDHRAQAAQRLEAWEETAQEQAREIESLREQLHQQQKEGQTRNQDLNSTAGSRSGNQDSRPDGEVALEIQKQQALGEKLRTELQALEEELAKIGEEANGKIDTANNKIRVLRQERDEAAREVEENEMGLRRLKQTHRDLNEEKAKLEEQKKALLEIVDDLHQTCLSAGLTMTQRRSVDSMSGFNYP